MCSLESSEAWSAHTTIPGDVSSWSPRYWYPGHLFVQDPMLSTIELFVLRGITAKPDPLKTRFRVACIRAAVCGPTSRAGEPLKACRRDRGTHEAKRRRGGPRAWLDADELRE